MYNNNNNNQHYFLELNRDGVIEIFMILNLFTLFSYSTLFFNICSFSYLI